MSLAPTSLLTLMIACGASDPESTADTQGEDTGADDASTDWGGTEDGGEDAPPDLPAYSGDACPTMADGMVEGFGADGRRFRLLLPDEPAGAPVIYTWHWLGGSASDIVNYMGLQDLADDGAVVVAPVSGGNAYEWEFLAGPDDNTDLRLFDDVLACLYEQHNVDTDQVFTTGMSAGGLWSTYLIVHRAQYLTAAAPFSGGIDMNAYVAPQKQIPVMLTWGGPTDEYAGYSFDTANDVLSGLLQDDGHFVVECEHTGGHTLPRTATDMLWTFFQAHSDGPNSTAWADGVPDSMPSWCGVAPRE